MKNSDSIFFYKADHVHIEEAQRTLQKHLIKNDVVVIYVENKDVVLPPFESYLSAQEITDMDSFKAEERRVQYLISQWFLKNLLCTLLQVSATDLFFKKGPLGKPYLDQKQNMQNIDFNISHTKDVTLIGFAKGMQIGVDVEKIVEKKFSEALAARFFKPDEVDWIQKAADAGEKRNRFFRIWCMKEAVIKAVGGGIFQNIQQISFTEQNGVLKLNSSVEPFSFNDRWITYEFHKIEDHACSIALFKSP